MSTVVEIAARLRDAVDELAFGEPVTHVYNPLRYAWGTHRRYLERFGERAGRVVLVGMNPGPWGMAQTGVPFGDVTMVREWMGLEGTVGRPRDEHPKRVIEGFACPRNEVSGSRLWGWARARFGTPEAFFERFFVANYCPLSFLEESGRNRTPNRLKKAEREALFAVCDEALRDLLAVLAPRAVVGVGRFAAGRAEGCLPAADTPCGCILHPSPANPRANAAWEETVERQLEEMGLCEKGE